MKCGVALNIIGINVKSSHILVIKGRVVMLSISVPHVGRKIIKQNDQPKCSSACPHSSM